MAGKTKNKTRPQIIDASERRAYVIEQRKGGNSYRLIAAAAIARFGIDNLPKGYDSRYACDDVMAELKRIQDQTSEETMEIRTLELERLDRMQAALWDDVVRANPAGPERDAAIDRVLKIMQRRSALLGLDAPKNVDFGSKDGSVSVQIYIPDNGRDDSS